MDVSRRALFGLALAAAGAAAMPTPGRAAPKVRIGILKFGTVSWELETIRRHGFDAENGVALDIVPFAGEDASNVAFLAGDLDMIVSDWLWVSRLRADGDDVTLVPYSTAVGAIMVREEAPIHALGDLAGRKAFGFVTHQKAEGVEARGLGKRAQRDDDRFVIHISTIADIWIWCNRRHGEIKQPPARPDHPRKRDRLPAAETRRLLRPSPPP